VRRTARRGPDPSRYWPGRTPELPRQTERFGPVHQAQAGYGEVPAGIRQFGEGLDVGLDEVDFQAATLNGDSEHGRALIHRSAGGSPRGPAPSEFTSTAAQVPQATAGAVPRVLQHEGVGYLHDRRMARHELGVLVGEPLVRRCESRGVVI